MKIEAILFDKDGTLIDFTDTWLPIYQSAAKAIATHNGDSSIARTLLRKGGYREQTNTWEPDSLLASGSNQQILDFWQRQADMTFSPSLREQLDNILRDEHLAAKAVIEDLPEYMQLLREQGYKLGVATMDDESPARKTLQKLGVLPYLNFVCGADSGFGTKPDSGMLNAFSLACGSDSNCIAMVGDSPRDLQMAQNGDALAIGVLTGASDANALRPYAHFVLNDIGEVPELLQGLAIKSC